MEENEELMVVNRNSDSEDENTFQIYKYLSEIPVVGYHPKGGIEDEMTSPTKKMKLCPTMRSELNDKQFMNKFKETWVAEKTMHSNEVELIANPFRVCILNNFIEGAEIVNSIRQDFNEVKWSRRNMDLYEFFQSSDLQHVELEYIKGFYEFMKNTVMPWVANLMGYDLIKISATCSCYTNTDYLLVHDDQREDRMVAFVYYMTGPEGWDSSKGGHLDLLSKDEHGLPSEVIRSILPKNNQLILFPVTNSSYHQVAEVTTIDDSRLTINGWFHGRTAQVFEIPHFEYPSNGLFGTNRITPRDTDVLLESWVNEKYLSNDGTLDDIQKHIEENSEISLRNFFRDDVLKDLMLCMEMLENNGNKWRQAAPPDRSSYEILTMDSLPSTLETFLDLLQSERFFTYLKSITNLDLKSLQFEFQRWNPGSYCLLSDRDWNSTQELDLIVYFPLGNEMDIIGGSIQYVDPEQEIQEALITVEPSKNTLNVVYRDTGRFIKYYSKMSKCKKFYLLMCSYSE